MSNVDLANLDATAALELFKAGQLTPQQLTAVLTGKVTKIEIGEAYKGNAMVAFRNADFHRGCRAVSAQTVLMILEHASKAKELAEQALAKNPPKHGVKV